MKESPFLISLRKRLKAPLVASVFIFSVMNLTSCENDKPEISSPAENIADVDLLPPNAAGLKVATIGNLGGSVAKALKNEDLEMYSADMSNTDFSPSTGTLLIDIDNLNAIERDAMNDFMDNAGKKVKLIIFESGTRNAEKIKNFFNVQFGGSERTGDISSVMVHYVSNGRVITPIGKKLHNDAKFLVDGFLSNPKLEVLSKQMKDSKQPLGSEVKSSASRAGITTPRRDGENYYQNTPINSIIEAARSSVRNGRIHSINDLKWVADPAIHALTSSYKQGELLYGPGAANGNAYTHDARGKCQNQQKAQLSQAVTVQKTWQISTTLGEKTPVKGAGKLLSEIAAAAGIGVSSATAQTTTSGTALDMRYEFAVPYIYQLLADYDGRFIGEVTFRVVIKSDGIRSGQSFDIKIGYTADQVNNNKFSGIRPKTDVAPAFSWYEYGDLLPKCN